jgi:hypothetical protein
MPVGAVFKPALIQMPGRIFVKLLIVFLFPGFFRKSDCQKKILL